ncbi:GNAT family N-acetyltransferase [Ectothiorhodospira shaposhnikovii]|uniref:GNAT family N-acetyltransferase n=1 Tax=Ectothiorhodospira shaposhnikovii TaxID=1054 RepID=UPI00399F5D50
MDAPMGRVRVFESLAALPEACRALFEQAECRHPFCTWAWFECLIAHGLNPDEAPRFPVAFDAGGQPVCVLPCLVSRARPRRWRALQNYYAPMYGPVMAAGSRGEEGLRAIVRHLRSTPGLCDGLDLGPLCLQGPMMGRVEQALRDEGFFVKPYFRFGNRYLPTMGMDWVAYLADRPGHLRSTLQRKGRRLRRLHGVAFHLYRQVDDVPVAVAAYESVYAVSWKRPEPFPDFMPGLIHMAARTGMLRLGVLTVEEAPVAVQLWLRHQGRAHIYKLAHDPRFEAFSPGTLLTALMMERMLDDERVSEVDFLTGDDPYKADWMPHRREQWGILALNVRTWRGALLMLRELVATWGGRLLRRGWPGRFPAS